MNSTDTSGVSALLPGSVPDPRSYLRPDAAQTDSPAKHRSARPGGRRPRTQGEFTALLTARPARSRRRVFDGQAPLSPRLSDSELSACSPNGGVSDYASPLSKLRASSSS